MKAQDLAGTLASVAKLQVQPPEAWMQACMSQVSCLQCCTLSQPPAMAHGRMMLVMLAMRHYITLGWPPVQVLHCLRSFKVEELSTVLYACARMRFMPNEQLLQSICR
jgi:hypothetical protein